MVAEETERSALTQDGPTSTLHAKRVATQQQHGHGVGGDALRRCSAVVGEREEGCGREKAVGGLEG